MEEASLPGSSSFFFCVFVRFLARFIDSIPGYCFCFSCCAFVFLSAFLVLFFCLWFLGGGEGRRGFFPLKKKSSSSFCTVTPAKVGVFCY